MRMSPGSSIDIASSAVTAAAVRSTLWPRASISSLRERSIELSGQKPIAHPCRRAERSGAMDRLYARASSSSGGSKIASTLSPSMESIR
jgi:hypothetical protein